MTLAPNVARRSGITLLDAQKSNPKKRRGCVVSNSRFRPSSGAVHATSPRTRILPWCNVVHPRAGGDYPNSCVLFVKSRPTTVGFSALGIQGVYARCVAGTRYCAAIASGTPGGSFDPFLGGKKGVPATASCIREPEVENQFLRWERAPCRELNLDWSMIGIPHKVCYAVFDPNFANLHPIHICQILIVMATKILA